VGAGGEEAARGGGLVATKRNNPSLGVGSSFMKQFPKDVLDAVAKEKEVRLTTYGRSTGKESSVTIWVVTDGDKVYIRSGQGLKRHWPKNLLARPEGTVQLDGKVVHFKSRHVTDPAEARHSSKLYGPKYGTNLVKPSNEDEPLTPGEQAAFELIPSSS
jgi:deazaflavin-dependent oxidoreductase (nitroreductase family)